MKKEKMITRTLIFTDVEIVAFDSTTMTGAKKVVPVVGNLKTDKEAMKAVLVKELSSMLFKNMNAEMDKTKPKTRTVDFYVKKVDGKWLITSQN